MARPSSRPQRWVVSPTLQGDRLTLAEASALSGLSYQWIHRLVTRGAVPGKRDPRGYWTISRTDAAKIARHPRTKAARRAVMLRVPVPRYTAWEREAARRGLPVSTLAGELLDEARGYKSEEP